MARQRLTVRDVLDLTGFSAMRPFTVSRELGGRRWSAIFFGAQQVAVCDDDQQAGQIADLLNEFVELLQVVPR